MAKSKNATKVKTKAATAAKVTTKKTPVKTKAAKVVKAKSVKKLKSTKSAKTLKTAVKAKKVTVKAAKTKSVKKAVSVKPAAKKSMTAKALAPNKKTLAQAKPAKLTVTNVKMTPLDDRLLVEVDAAEKKTAGGLYIPDTAQVTGNYQGKVLAVGRGHMNKKGKTKPMDVKVGDVILFSEYAGEKYSESDKDIRIIREADVLGVVSNEK